MGLQDIVDSVEEKAEGLIDKAKSMVSDEDIDKVADKVTDVTPDKVDPFVEKAAEAAKKLND
ncbi:MAG: hypothetical protein LBH13_05165 [Cellulomonadaceae bacterium]|nr:hypothetical protein [Cellulomonadaceae bacterium]